MREIEQHEFASIGGGDGMLQIPITRQRDDSTARVGTLQLSTSTNSGTSGGSNSGGGGTPPSTVTAPKPTTTTIDTVTQTCVDPRVTEVTFSVTGVTIKSVGGCTTVRSYTTAQSK